jgi:hypothetical protein
MKLEDRPQAHTELLAQINREEHEIVSKIAAIKVISSITPGSVTLRYLTVDLIQNQVVRVTTLIEDVIGHMREGVQLDALDYRFRVLRDLCDRILWLNGQLTALSELGHLMAVAVEASDPDKSGAS